MSAGQHLHRFCLFALTKVNPWVSRTPFDETTWLDRIVKVVVGEDGPNLSIPWTTESALASNIQSAVCLFDRAIVDIDTILVLKGSVAALPCSNSATTATELHLGRLDPESAEAVEEVCLARNSGIVHISVSKLANIDLCISLVIVGWWYYNETYSVLVAVEAAVVEASISVAHTECKRRTSRVWQVVVYKVEIVCTKVCVSKGGSWWHWIAIGTTTGSARVECGSNGQSASV